MVALNSTSRLVPKGTPVHQAISAGLGIWPRSLLREDTGPLQRIINAVLPDARTSDGAKHDLPSIPTAQVPVLFIGKIIVRVDDQGCRIPDDRTDGQEMEIGLAPHVKSTVLSILCQQDQKPGIEFFETVGAGTLKEILAFGAETGLIQNMLTVIFRTLAQNGRWSLAAELLKDPPQQLCEAVNMHPYLFSLRSASPDTMQPDTAPFSILLEMADEELAQTAGKMPKLIDYLVCFGKDPSTALLDRSPAVLSSMTRSISGSELSIADSISFAVEKGLNTSDRITGSILALDLHVRNNMFVRWPWEHRQTREIVLNRLPFTIRQQIRTAILRDEADHEISVTLGRR